MSEATTAVPDAAYWRRLLGEEGYASALAHSRAVCAAVGDGGRGARGAPVPGLAGARRAAGLTQRALARPVGISQFTISKYERGLMGVSGDTLRRLAAALRVPPARLTDAPRQEGTA